ncbi:hypothetical protein MMC32_001931 [Xylographa parallela]|nr:hypothetical protein [Xylographa parallela]
MPGIVDGETVKKIAISEGWWLDVSKSIIPSTRKLLESYSGIAPDQVVPHVEETVRGIFYLVAAIPATQYLFLGNSLTNISYYQRLDCFELFPNPYFGKLYFLSITINHHPRYKEILERIFTDEVLLDFDCGLGQNIRQLVNDGVVIKNIYGLNFDKRHTILGWELFRDRRTLCKTFMVGTVRNQLHKLSDLAGKCRLIHVAGFFGSYLMVYQLHIARYLIERLRPRKGCWIVGQQAANLHSGDYAAPHGGPMVYQHNIESWTEFWKEVGLQTGTRWRVEAVLEEPVLDDQTPEGLLPNTRRMVFTVIMEEEFNDPLAETIQ